MALDAYNIPSNLKNSTDFFYQRINNADFSKIDFLKIAKLKKQSIELKQIYDNDKNNSNFSKYIELMRKIKQDSIFNQIENDAEKYLLFMFTVDPNFDAYIIYEQSYTRKEFKYNMEKRFGIFDLRLYLLEKHFIKCFATKKEKERINEKIFR